MIATTKDIINEFELFDTPTCVWKIDILENLEGTSFEQSELSLNQYMCLHCEGSLTACARYLPA